MRSACVYASVFGETLGIVAPWVPCRLCPIKREDTQSGPPPQGLWDNLKRVAVAAFAMRATERNPNFVGAARATGPAALTRATAPAVWG